MLALLAHFTRRRAEFGADTGPEYLVVIGGRHPDLRYPL